MDDPASSTIIVLLFGTTTSFAVAFAFADVGVGTRPPPPPPRGTEVLMGGGAFGPWLGFDEPLFELAARLAAERDGTGGGEYRELIDSSPGTCSDPKQSASAAQNRRTKTRRRTSSSPNSG